MPFRVTPGMKYRLLAVECCPDSPAFAALCFPV